MQTIEWPDERLRVDGLPWWNEVSPNLWRLPQRYEGVVPKLVYDLSHQPSGARLRFRTDARSIWLNVKFPHINVTIFNMSKQGQMGLDYWVDGEYRRAFTPLVPEGRFCFFDGLPQEQRDITVYLSQYAALDIVSLEVTDGATFTEPLPYALDKPLAIYGSSITQGGASSRPSLAWPSILGRALNLDIVNMGFSGAALGEPELAEVMGDIDACAYILEWGVNVASAAKLRAVYGPFLGIIRARRPGVPIICVTPIYSSWESHSPDPRLPDMRVYIREDVTARQASDPNLHLVEGYDLLGPCDSDGICDQTHPNDIGFKYMATRIEPTVREVLGL